MKRELILAALAGAGLVLLVLLAVAIRYRRNHKVDPRYFTERWVTLQKHCATRKSWPQAVAEADDLLHEALKRTGYKGKTMGERLVAAQHVLTTNDSVWFGHKLRTKIANQDARTIKKQDVLEALSGFRQALRDLGVLK